MIQGVFHFEMLRFGHIFPPPISIQIDGSEWPLNSHYPARVELHPRLHIWCLLDCLEWLQANWPPAQLTSQSPWSLVVGATQRHLLLFTITNCQLDLLSVGIVSRTVDPAMWGTSLASSFTNLALQVLAAGYGRAYLTGRDMALTAKHMSDEWNNAGLSWTHKTRWLYFKKNLYYDSCSIQHLNLVSRIKM